MSQSVSVHYSVQGVRHHLQIQWGRDSVIPLTASLTYRVRERVPNNWLWWLWLVGCYRDYRRRVCQGVNQFHRRRRRWVGCLLEASITANLARCEDIVEDGQRRYRS